MRRITLPAILLVTALAVTGCSAANTTSSVAPDAGGAKTGAVAPQPANVGPFASGGGTDTAVTTNRDVVTTGTVTITANDPIAASDSAVSIVEAAGGRVDARTETAPVGGDHGSATLNLRIPASALTATLNKLKKLGSVDSVQISTTDVTTQAQDMDAQINALSASVDRLLKLLSTAKDTAVLIDLESAISSRQGELDGLKAQRRLLTDQIAMSTLSLNLQSKAAQPLKAPSNFFDALGAGLSGFGMFFSVLFLVLGYLLPWLVFAGVVTFVIIWLVRRNRRKAAVAAAPPTVK